MINRDSDQKIQIHQLVIFTKEQEEKIQLKTPGIGHFLSIKTDVLPNV